MKWFSTLLGIHTISTCTKLYGHTISPHQAYTPTQINRLHTALPAITFLLIPAKPCCSIAERQSLRERAYSTQFNVQNPDEKPHPQWRLIRKLAMHVHIEQRHKDPFPSHKHWYLDDRFGFVFFKKKKKNHHPSHWADYDGAGRGQEHESLFALSHLALSSHGQSIGVSTSILSP